MKRVVVLLTFICFAMICACQKQDSAAEAQLAQRKAELDTREKALDEKEKALVERGKAVANSRIIQSRQQARNPAEVEAEREKRLQQLPPELRALVPNPAQVDSAKLAKEHGNRRPSAAIAGRLEEERRKKMNAGTESPNAESSDMRPAHCPCPRQNKSGPLQVLQTRHSAPLKAD